MLYQLKFLVPIIAASVLTVFATTAHAVDTDQIPFLSDENKNAMARDFESSDQKCRASYVAVVSKNGAWASFCSRKASEADIARIALEKCEHIAQDLCGIVFLGGKNRTFKQQAPSIRYPKTIDASQIPFVRSDARAKLNDRYVAANGHKALAITRNGTYGYTTGEDSESDARRAALSDCEEHDRNRGRCFIYAVGDTVEFNSKTNIYADRN